MQAGVRLNKIEVVGQQADGVDAPQYYSHSVPVLCEGVDLSKVTSLKQTTEKADHVLLIDRIPQNPRSDDDDKKHCHSTYRQKNNAASYAVLLIVKVHPKVLPSFRVVKL